MGVGWKLNEANSELDRILGFFPRVDAKASFIFAIDTAMLAVMPFNMKTLTNWGSLSAICAYLTTLLITYSLYEIYRCAYPNLKGGARSLIYFREIAKLREAEYIDEIQSVTEEQYLKELIAQTWRNSEILTLKYDSMKHAFASAALALIPWFGFLVSTSYAESLLTH